MNIHQTKSIAFMKEEVTQLFVTNHQIPVCGAEICVVCEKIR